MQRMSTGIEGFDALIGGGVPQGSLIALRGSPGSGKTTFGLQFLKNGAEQERELGVYISFEQLPEQIYLTAETLGWDLRSLEEQGLLRIISTSPDALLDALQESGGPLEQIATQARRAVIDSVALFDIHGNGESLRNRLLRLRGILNRLGLTTLLIDEQWGGSVVGGPLSFLADGLVNLYFETRPDGYRAREVEVVKMRGTAIVSGRHLFRIGEGGLSVYPALTTADIVPLSGEAIPTGIPEMDELLGGGVASGSTVLIDANSRADFRILAGNLIAQRVRRGEGLAINSAASTLPGGQSESLLAKLGIDVEELAQTGRLLVAMYGAIDVPQWADSVLVQLSDYPEEDRHVARMDLIRERMDATSSTPWTWFRDLNALVASEGEEYLGRYFAEEQGLCQQHGVTTFCIINGAEIRPTSLSKLQRVSTAALRTWVDGRYQYLEVLKSPTGRVSEPFLLQYGPVEPYVMLR